MKKDEINNQKDNDEFIKYFGEEKFAEEEMLSMLQPYLFMICQDLNLEPIPVVFEIINEDSRFFNYEKYISISSIFRNNFLESLKCLIHQLRHYYQYELVNSTQELSPIALEWQREFQNIIMLSANPTIEEITKHSFQAIEVDSYAYTQKMILKYLNLKIHHPNLEYQVIIEQYSLKYFN